RKMEMAVPVRVPYAAETGNPLRPRRTNIGYVFVVDDLTEPLLAQKSAAWQEVARRIAHEIKNPLTPIQLSSQRLIRHLQRRTESQAPHPLPPHLPPPLPDSSPLLHP